MKTPILTLLASIVVALAFGSGAYAQACIDNPAQIQSLISQGQVISQYDAVASAGYNAADILNYRLCEQGGGYVWIIGILSADGTAQNITVSAQ